MRTPPPLDNNISNGIIIISLNRFQMTNDGFFSDNFHL